MSNGLFSATSISASGMSAERQRMELVANNIANARTTHSVDDQPYRRRHLILGTASDPSVVHTARPGNVDSDSLSGVRVLGVGFDESEFQRVYMDGHPDADEEGFVLMPNVRVPNEMVDLISASRSYEANLRALTLYKDMVEQTLGLLNGAR